MEEREPALRAGANIAMKLPPALFDATVRFYRDVVRLPVLEAREGGCSFEFGAMRLWLDREPAVTGPEIWLELIAEDTAAAAERLREAGVRRRDEVEALPEGFDGFWIESPAGVIHLVAGAGQ